MNGLTTVILAAGEGKRMRSRQRRYCMSSAAAPLISYSLRLARTVGDRIVLVVGPDADAVRAAAGEGVAVVEQRRASRHRPRGAPGARPLRGRRRPILVLPNDVPLLSAETLERLRGPSRVDRRGGHGAHRRRRPPPHGYGASCARRGRVKRIVEDRDATDDEKKVGEINTSVYCFDGRRLWSVLERERPEKRPGEYYLTDVIGLLGKAGGRIERSRSPIPEERRSASTTASSSRRWRAIPAPTDLDRHMLAGVTILDPATHVHRRHGHHRRRHASSYPHADRRRGLRDRQRLRHRRGCQIRGRSWATACGCLPTA